MVKVIRNWQFGGKITNASPEWIQSLYEEGRLILMQPPDKPSFLAIVRKYGMTPVEIGEYVAQIERDKDEIIRLESIK